MNLAKLHNLEVIICKSDNMILEILEKAVNHKCGVIQLF